MGAYIRQTDIDVWQRCTSAVQELTRTLEIFEHSPIFNNGRIEMRVSVRLPKRKSREVLQYFGVIPSRKTTYRTIRRQCAKRNKQR